MSNSADFTTHQDAIMAVTDEQTETPIMPMATYLAEAETLEKVAKKDSETLQGAGLPLQVIDTLASLTGAAREAQSLWSIERFAQKEAKIEPSTDMIWAFPDFITPSTDMIWAFPDTITPSSDMIWDFPDTITPSTDMIWAFPDTITPSSDMIWAFPDTITPSSDTITPSTDYITPSTEFL